MSAREAMPRARELAQRALTIDPDLPEAHAMLGIVAGQHDFDWSEADRRFRLAVAREPLSPHLRQWYALFLLFSTGRIDEARRQIERVLEEDPLCQMWHNMHSYVLQGAGLTDEAIEAMRRAVDLDPQFWWGWMQLGLLCGISGRHSEALHCAEKSVAAAPWSPYSMGLMAGALENLGQHERAEPLLTALRADASRGPTGLACWSVLRGDIEGAVDWVGKAADQRFTGVVMILIRVFEPLLRQSVRWPALLKKINLA
jgi:serine/threonine-protein kinase